MFARPAYRPLLAAAILVATLTSPAATLAAGKPPNDLMSNATPITALPFSASVDLTKATWTSTDPSVCWTGLSNVWYAYTPTMTQQVVAWTSGDYYAGFQVYYSAPGIGSVADECWTGDPTHVHFQMNAGVTYYIEVTTPYGATSIPKGTSTFTLDTMGPPPANDEPSGAFAVSPGTVTGTTYAATANPLTDLSGAATGFPNVWYKYSPTTNGRYSMQMDPSTTFYYALSAASVDSTGTQSFICNTNTASACFFDTVAGSTYYFEIGGGNAPGGGPFSFTLAPAPLIHPVVTVNSTGTVSRAAGTATITGTVTCDLPARFDLGVIVTQGTTTGSAVPAGFYDCSPTPTAWSATITATTGAFASGPATLTAGGSGFSANGDSDYATEVTISGILTPK